MTTEMNPIFRQNYADYLRQMESARPALWGPVLNIAVDENSGVAEVPFFRRVYQVSPGGVVDDQGQRPDYATCVILLKHLLMCPAQVPHEREWTPYREFPDSGQSQNTGLADRAKAAICNRYANRLESLVAAAGKLGGRPPETDYPYDLAVVIQVLPRIPILFLFNAADAQFPAQAFILYERRAASFLDAECRVMVDGLLYQRLKSAEQA